ncbi:CHASE2 domain-containing protein [Hyalangium versicolor]|uniref:CHASE2 domain-containing protein n=1 Tax=Hyalangium versicolor TaxID=2861190 RepID=UPI001CCE7660|nr:adenylate/guanylate cyclase domain-containing protein [Hyalangium versicolor]
MASDTWKVLRLRLRNHLPLMLGVAVLSTLVPALCWKGGLLWLPTLERALYDSALTHFTRAGPSTGIVVVAIDQSSLDGVRNNPSYARNFGNYPWTRSLWARVVEQLAHEGARAVLFDMVMDERDTDASADLDFAQALRTTGLPIYMGVATHPRAAPLPKIDPVHVPRPFLPPAVPQPPAVGSAGGSAPPSPSGNEEFQEVDENDVQPPTDPLEAARALTFPVRTNGHELPLLEYESEQGFRERYRPVPPIASLLPEAAGFGLVEVEPDPDGRMRRTRFAYTDGDNTYVTLPVALAADLFGATELVFSGRTLQLGSRTFEVNPDGSAELDFGGMLHDRFPVIPVVAVLDDRALRDQGKPTMLPADLFRGRIVVVGGMAVGLGDNKPTPFSASTPGVSKQLAVLENLLAGRFVTEAPFWVSLLFGLGLALVSAVLLMTLRVPALEFAWVAVVVVIVYGVLGASLAQSRVHVLSALPMASGLLACMGAMAFNHLFASREAAFIRQAFNRYMEPRLIEQMIEENQLPKLDGEEREITAFFSDIRGFSTFSERFKQDPRSLVRVLNQYLTRVSTALLHEGGCLDKYIGDAVVCLFGAPVNHSDHAVRACKAALVVQSEVELLRAHFRHQGLPDVYTRIGLNSDRLFVGNFGSDQLFDYTAMGDGMNLASRLEGANKAYGSLIMIGPRTYQLAQDAIEARELDQVRVAGKTEAVTVYELLALKGELPAEKRETVERYHEALGLYRKRRFAEAASLLKARLAKDPEDGPTASLLARCQKYVEMPPPSGWDGVTSLDK